MSDLADEIPQRAFINAEIFQLALKTGALDSATSQISKKYSIPEYSVENPAYIVSLLYCLVVFPKELWKYEINDELTNSINSFGDEIINLFQIQTWNNRPINCTLYGERCSFLNKIRNSISHANIYVDAYMNFTFFDKDKYGKNFECTSDCSSVMEFISKIGSVLANIRSHKISYYNTPTGIH